MNEKRLFELLDQHNIHYQIHEHKPVFTVTESAHLIKAIPGAHSKNLFLRNKKKSYYALVSVLESKRVDIKKLSNELGQGRLSFGSADDLLSKLGITSGAVTPFALINDTEKAIAFILDKDFLSYQQVNFHPLRNDMTISVPTDDFIKFFKLMNIQVNQLVVP